MLTVTSKTTSLDGVVKLQILIQNTFFRLQRNESITYLTWDLIAVTIFLKNDLYVLVFNT